MFLRQPCCFHSCLTPPQAGPNAGAVSGSSFCRDSRTGRRPCCPEYGRRFFCTAGNDGSRVFLRRRGFHTAGILLTAIWAVGCCISAALVLRHILKIRRIKKLAYPITPETEPDLYSRYLSCIRELKIAGRLPCTPPAASPVLYPTASCGQRSSSPRHGRPAGRGGYTLYLSP